jgi:Rrf2 family protein
MTELAQVHGQGKLVSIAEIARTESLPLAYLEQLVGELRKAGLVEGLRGVRGGYRLTKEPSTITIGEVYRILEGEVSPVDCTSEGYHPGACSMDHACPSKNVWDRVQQAILGVLDSTSLQDMLHQEAAQQAASLISIDTLSRPRPESLIPA